MAPAHAHHTSLSEPPIFLLATTNPGKVQELLPILSQAPCRWVTLADLGITTEVKETGHTCAENAILKARTYCQMTGLPTLADDSGLEVDALGGEPGARAKVYAGENATDPQRIAFLLQKLQGVPWERRTARFRSVIALAFPDGRVYAVEGTLEGIIALAPHGTGGFGYDPVFYLPDRGKTVAQLSLEEKNAISHRGQAARRAVALLQKILASAHPQED
ncbi:MAG: RdgB/HAM1 family non-canonical purine NTP pyrophosphatase [Dehalococcoidia bacterium]|nr:RdgB/HAM1 family non-canonical purine NTP pyrophosphatase [Dehalococcoidia bacterium]MDW8119333.1 RdgB/HAM1 family non-canonical purine NTP pyrophosphatase [Chloroflexota bacterium]